MIDIDVQLLGAEALQDGGRPFLRFGTIADMEKAAAMLAARAQHAQPTQVVRTPQPTAKKRSPPPLPRDDEAELARSHTSSPELAMPEHILPIRVSSARAVSLGYRPYAAIASVFVTNVRVDAASSTLVADNAGPVIAVAAEHSRVLASLAPPTISNIDLEGARRGMPALRLPRLGLFKRGLRLASCPAQASPMRGAAEARASAERWLAELDKAWLGRVRSVVLVGWPVYPARDGNAAVLDAAEGNLLPPLTPNLFTKEAKERTR